MNVMKKNIIIQVAILTSCNILTYILFFLYRVLLSRHIGANGMGLWTFALNTYYFFYSLTSGGIQTSIAKNISEKKDIEYSNKVVFIISKVVLLFTIFGALLFFFLSEFISFKIYNATLLKAALYPLCVCIIVTGQSAILKGFFYGIQNPAPPALGEIFENVIRLSCMTTVFLVLKLTFEQRLILSTFGILIGEISSLTFLVISYKLLLKKSRFFINYNQLFEIMFSIFKISVPIALMGILSNLFQVIENKMIPMLFQKCSINFDEAISLFGIINGMSYPVAFLPLVIINSLSIIIIPTISEMFDNKSILSHRIDNFVLATILLSLPFSAIFLFYSNQICQFFYNNQLAGFYLKHISFALTFYYLSIIFSSILNALSEVKFNFYINISTSIIRLIAFYFLINIFKVTLLYIWINNVIAFVSCCVMIGRIKKWHKFSLNFLNKTLILGFLCIISLIFVMILNISTYWLSILIFIILYTVLSFALLYPHVNK